MQLLNTKKLKIGSINQYKKKKKQIFDLSFEEQKHLPSMGSEFFPFFFCVPLCFCFSFNIWSFDSISKREPPIQRIQNLGFQFCNSFYFKRWKERDCDGKMKRTKNKKEGKCLFVFGVFFVFISILFSII